MKDSDFLLTIETSSNEGTVSLTQSGRLVGEELAFPAGRGNGATLYEPINSLMKRLEQRAEGLGAVLVGIGPGNYSGVRIALGAGLGIATGLNIPLYGRGSFESHSAVEACGDFWGFGDARRGRFFRIEIRGGVQSESIELMTVEEARVWLEQNEAKMRKVVGLGDVSGFPDELSGFFDSSASVKVSAAGLAHAFSELDECKRQESLNPQPFYLRGPNITPPRRKSAFAR